jgi:hypothetical protein
MADNGIKRGIVPTSTPRLTLVKGSETVSVGWGEVLNEYLAQLVRVLLKRPSLSSVTPPPYVLFLSNSERSCSHDNAVAWLLDAQERSAHPECELPSLLEIALTEVSIML